MRQYCILFGRINAIVFWNWTEIWNENEGKELSQKLENIIQITALNIIFVASVV